MLSNFPDPDRPTRKNMTRHHPLILKWPTLIQGQQDFEDLHQELNGTREHHKRQKLITRHLWGWCTPPLNWVLTQNNSRYWYTDTNHQKPSVACKRSISFLEASWIERTWNRSCQHQDEKTPHSAWVIPPDAPETMGVWLIKCLGQTTSSTFFISRSGFLNDALCCIKCVTYSTNNIPHSFIHVLWVKHTTQCHSSLIICISHCFRSQYLSGPWQPGFCLPLGWWWGDTGPSAVFQHFDFHLTLLSSEK